MMTYPIGDWDSDWGLRLGIKITIFEFGDLAFGIRNEDFTV